MEVGTVLHSTVHSLLYTVELTVKCTVYSRVKYHKQVWDLSQVCCTAVLSSTLARLSPSLLLLSDYMMVVLLPSGRISHWPLASLLPPPSSPPIRLDLDFPHATIESQDPVRDCSQIMLATKGEGGLENTDNC